MTRPAISMASTGVEYVDHVLASLPRDAAVEINRKAVPKGRAHFARALRRNARRVQVTGHFLKSLGTKTRSSKAKGFVWSMFGPQFSYKVAAGTRTSRATGKTRTQNIIPALYATFLESGFTDPSGKYHPPKVAGGIYTASFRESESRTMAAYVKEFKKRGGMWARQSMKRQPLPWWAVGMERWE